MVSKDGKWFFSVTPGTDVLSAAAEVLTSRGEVVKQFATRELADYRESPEPVHQLRVATRRLAAALKIFATCLPDKMHGRVKKANARLRRVAGELRDLDVKVPILRERLLSSTWMDDALDSAIQDTVSRRHAHIAERFASKIEGRARKYRKRFKQLVTNLDDEERPQQKTKETFGRLAEKELRERCDVLKGAGGFDLHDVEHLHQFRIACKRLRYCLEVTSGCVNSEACTSLYQFLRDLQSQLGHVNDLRNLYSLLAQQRSIVLKEFRGATLERFAMQYDRLAATIAFDWFDHQRTFVSRWAAMGRSQFESHVQRLWKTNATPRDGRGRTRAIGFPISGATVTPIISGDPD